MVDLIKPKEVELKNRDGEVKKFIISRLPAIPMREVMAKYPVSNIPKLGEYQASEEVMKLLLSHAAVEVGDEGRQIRLSSASLINNHVDDAEQLLRLEYAMLEYNTSFFGQGGASTFLKGLIAEYLPLITQTVTASLHVSSVRDLGASAPSNSAKS